MVSIPAYIAIAYVVISIIIVIWTYIATRGGEDAFFVGLACVMVGMFVLAGCGIGYDYYYKPMNAESVLDAMDYTGAWKDDRINNRLKECLEDGELTRHERESVYDVAELIKQERLKNTVDSFKFGVTQ